MKTQNKVKRDFFIQKRIFAFYWFLLIRYLLLVIFYSLLTTFYSLLTIYSLFLTFYLLRVTFSCYSRLLTCCSLIINFSFLYVLFPFFSSCVFNLSLQIMVWIRLKKLSGNWFLKWFLKYVVIVIEKHMKCHSLDQHFLLFIFLNLLYSNSQSKSSRLQMFYKINSCSLNFAKSTGKRLPSLY